MVADITEKVCSTCGFILPISKFNTQCGTKDGYRNVCKDCCNKRRKNWEHKIGKSEPASSTHARSVYLGVIIGEEIACKYFKNPVRAPYGTPGYDLICQNGFKIDVKLATANKDGAWSFSIKNRSGEKPDYYLLLAMDDTDDLSPCHIWIVPANAIIGKGKICDRQSFMVSPTTLHKLSKYEKPIEKLECVCNMMKENSSEV